MRVLFSAYWNGAYPRPGDRIEVEEGDVALLEQNHFAERLAPEPTTAGRPAKGGKHGTR